MRIPKMETYTIKQQSDIRNERAKLILEKGNPEKLNEILPYPKG